MNEHKMEQQGQATVEKILRNADVAFSSEKVGGEANYDFVIHLSKQQKYLCFNYKHTVSPQHFDFLKERICANAPKGAQAGLVVRRLTPSLLDGCKAAGLCVFDLEGNGYLRVPGVFFERYRPTALSVRQPSAGTGFTAKASRLVRALLSTAIQHPGMRRTDLVQATGLSKGYVSILVDRLVRDGYLSNRFDRLYLEQPDRLLDDWAAHYRFDRHRRMLYAMSTRTYSEGMKKLGEQLRRTEVRFAFTAWSGAYLLAPHAEPPLFMAYVNKTPKSMEGIFPVEKGGNVMLLLPQDEGVFQFVNKMHRAGPVVCDAQVYLDLCRMPGRAQAQAEAFRHDCLHFESNGHDHKT